MEDAPATAIAPNEPSVASSQPATLPVRPRPALGYTIKDLVSKPLSDAVEATRADLAGALSK